ncbi:hypothetical protein CHU95_16975 [Niveispirillum lacus]|uniref:Uncharacterized protein n=1 Tax=Niveispirillum lacus TaxID=1981099 RepID=A0A255YUX0_9PROT|nr:hypothetical protein [Niveispirillum lacus]OYQ32484.1 hypothetical protein CHU95_16975 [Niveispirillum lacus]
MGIVIPFPGAAEPFSRAVTLADQLVDVTAGLPLLVHAVDDLGRSAESLCRTLQGGLMAMNQAFGQALRVNAAHHQIQVEAQAAIDLAATNPEAAAARLTELRADYARLTSPDFRA